MRPSEHSLRLKLTQRYGLTAGSHGLNSAEYMAEIRETCSEHFVELDRLWKAQFDGLSKNRADESYAIRYGAELDLIDTVRHWVSRGMMPPPERLIALNYCFESIEQFGDEFTLNQLILGSTKAGEKSRSRIGQKEALIRLLATVIDLEMLTDHPRSQAKIIEQFCIDRNLDPENVRRKLSRWRQKTIYKDISPTSRRVRIARRLNTSRTK